MAWILISARPHATRIGVAKPMEPDDLSSPTAEHLFRASNTGCR